MSQSVHEKALEIANEEWLNLGDTSQLEIVNPFSIRTQDEINNPHIHLLSLMRKPDYFGFTCKWLLNKTLAPFQMAALPELWFRPFPMFIATRGAGKTWLLALYAILRAIFQQGSKIVIVGAAFRQSKFLFENCENIWYNAPLLQDICSGNKRSGPRRDVDRCVFRIGDSEIVAIPLGAGDKIRGQRASVIISDEFSSIPISIYENVVEPFAAVSLDPITKLQEASRIAAYKRMGLWSEEQEANTGNGFLSNQSIISGTAYYSFNHFYTYWKKWKTIIESRGDIKKLEEVFHGEIPPSFNWKDYCVIRIPVKLMPPGFMDEKNIAKSKATVHTSQYNMEYGACMGFDSMVITNSGVKQIIDIECGDLVLTHKGRFRKVLKKTYRYFNGNIKTLKVFGASFYYSITPEHPIWQGGENWERLDNADTFNMANLNCLSNQNSIDITNFTSNVSKQNDKVFCNGNKKKFTDEEVKEIRESSVSHYKLAKTFNCWPNAIRYVRSNNQPKKSIPINIKLDYDFGLIIGYYASEGSVGSKGKLVCFALDGHVNIKFSHYVEQLLNAIQNVFKINAKIRKVQSNCVDVYITSRIVADLMKKICPGRAHEKFIDPTILFSNKEFMTGFVEGYWNGDGCLSNQTKATSVSLALLTQIKVALSYFGIGATLAKKTWTPDATICGVKTKKRQGYSLGLHGENERLFRKLFYSEENEPKIGGQIIINNGSFTKQPIKEISDEPYSGTVYNLEVEEDNSYSLLAGTVHNCFANDSNGFFKRTLIESCVSGQPANPIQHACGDVCFDAIIKGNINKRYVMGVDPASEHDNFSIVIIELWGDHRRIVFCWTVTRKRHKEKLKKGLVEEHDFYGYTARKIRELMSLFPCERVSVDSQGGGVAVMEALQDPKRLQPGERPIYPTINYEDPKDTDSLVGDHILEIVNFAKSDYVVMANHGMKKDFEDKVLLFPQFNSAILGLAIEQDKQVGRVRVDDDGIEKLYDTLEDAVMEIEELKDELATITHSPIGVSMRDRWDTPEVKMPGGKKGRLRKDRYSALLMANMGARTLQSQPSPVLVQVYGGFAKEIVKRSKDGPRHQSQHQNPSWYTEQVGEGKNFGASVKRSV